MQQFANAKTRHADTWCAMAPRRHVDRGSVCGGGVHFSKVRPVEMGGAEAGALIAKSLPGGLKIGSFAGCAMQFQQGMSYPGRSMGVPGEVFLAGNLHRVPRPAFF